jgi:3-dehydroquinate synthase
MHIKYKINNNDYNVTFYKDDIVKNFSKKIKSKSEISKNLDKLKHDKKILLAIDRKVNKQIIQNLIKFIATDNIEMKILYIDGSKKNKNLKTLFKIINCLFKNKFTKNSVLISCGGGVIGDVSGLSASLYLRGLNYMHIPTTMTAIVDSCIGGKNGVNFNNLINSLGTYYHPQNVYILKSIIECQPKREYISGIPEIIKCGLIKRSNLLSHIENKNKVLKRDFLFVSKLIKETLNIKIKFFKNDIEEKEERLKLNFGHTFAHAIESTLDNNIKNKKEILRHGEAVGLGLLCEIFYSNGKNKIFYKVRDLLSLYSLPINLKNIDINKNFLIKEIFKFIFYDKKKIGKFPRYINLQKIGNSKIDELRNHERIIQTIENVLFS